MGETSRGSKNQVFGEKPINFKLSATFVPITVFLITTIQLLKFKITTEYHNTVIFSAIKSMPIRSCVQIETNRKESMENLSLHEKKSGVTNRKYQQKVSICIGLKKSSRSRYS